MIIKRVGGKSKITNWLVSNFPKCSIFVDTFGGSGVVLDSLLKIEKNIRYVYNDADEKIFNFFKVLRENHKELSNLVFFTPYSRKFFEESIEILNASEYIDMDDIEKALRFLVVNRQSFGSKMENHWSITKNGEINYKTWNSMSESIYRTALLWKNVFLENLDYKELIRKWDDKNTLFYLDPPYEYVESDYYEVNKKTLFSHIEMFDILQTIQGSYCVSYYGGETDNEDSDLIKKYRESGCQVLKKKVTKHLSTQEVKDTAIEALIIKNNGEFKTFKKFKTQEIL